MSLAGRRFARALSRNHAETLIDDLDPRLRGRTYAIPFEKVWQAANKLAGGGLRGWKIVSSDDYEGVITAEVRSLFGSVDDVVIRITLDENAQTRVDMESRARKRAADLGASARRIGRFMRILDRRL